LLHYCCEEQCKQFSVKRKWYLKQECSLLTSVHVVVDNDTVSRIRPSIFLYLRSIWNQHSPSVVSVLSSSNMDEYGTEISCILCDWHAPTIPTFCETAEHVHDHLSPRIARVLSAWSSKSLLDVVESYYWWHPLSSSTSSSWCGMIRSANNKQMAFQLHALEA
jgi:hypothetical protein